MQMPNDDSKKSKSRHVPHTSMLIGPNTRWLKISQQHRVHKRDHRKEKQDACGGSDSPLIQDGYAVTWNVFAELK